jgi:Leucine-rich repeat (LRR) protein
MHLHQLQSLGLSGNHIDRGVELLLLQLVCGLKNLTEMHLPLPDLKELMKGNLIIK